MNITLKGAVAVAEPFAVFIGGAVTLKYVLLWSSFSGDRSTVWIPLVRIALIISLAIVVSIFCRRHLLRQWGLSSPLGTRFAAVKRALLLLLAGGFVPLLLTALFPAPVSRPEFQWISFLVPLLAQEVFLVGYARSRFAEGLAPTWTNGLVVALFIIAHIQHLSMGVAGFAFLLSMGWQGYCWTKFREQEGSLLLLVSAHAVLLLLYIRAMEGAIVLGVVGLVYMGEWFYKKNRADAKPDK